MLFQKTTLKFSHWYVAPPYYARKGWRTTPKRINFRKSLEVFNSKIFIAKFGHWNRAFSAWKWYKRAFLGMFSTNYHVELLYYMHSSWEIGSYNTQWSRHNELTHFCHNFVTILSRNPRYNFLKIRGAVWNFPKN